MIVDFLKENISPIFLSILLIIYLMIIELGDKKLKKALLPFVIVLLIIFSVVVVQDVISKL